MARKELLNVMRDLEKNNLAENILYNWHLKNYDFNAASNTLEEYKLDHEI